VRKLTGIDDFKFKYYKQPELHNVTEETLASIVPSTAVAYESAMSRVRTEGIKKFFCTICITHIYLL
jgi:hypothetical protein